MWASGGKGVRSKPTLRESLVTDWKNTQRISYVLRNDCVSEIIILCGCDYLIRKGIKIVVNFTGNLSTNSRECEIKRPLSESVNSRRRVDTEESK